MNELQVFQNEEFGSVRTIEINGVSWFVGKDIASALGYSDIRKAVVMHVDEDDKTNCPITDSIGREQNTTVINESGLYSLILGSKLPNAKRFKHWVTSEVLPAIRKTGSYHLPQTYAQALRELADLAEEKERMAVEMVAMNERIEEMQPKVSYLDKILESKETMLVTQIAQDYGMTAIKFNRLLNESGIQHKVGGQWILYSKYQGNGYVHSHTHHFEYSDGRSGTSENTEWTQKGRLFLYNILKEHGYLPTIEKEDT